MDFQIPLAYLDNEFKALIKQLQKSMIGSREKTYKKYRW